MNNHKNAFKVVGVMSGTSLDGLDLAFCRFELIDRVWKYHIEAAQTIKYSQSTLDLLTEAYSCSGRDLTRIDFEYGELIGKHVKDFIRDHNLQVDFVASHGHTVFHDPKKGYTLQIGKGSSIAAETNLPCICDFRTSDVSKGGQGAPLVPIGDKLLFTDFDICLNLGGFSNISYDLNKSRIAFDISPCNIVLNLFAQKLGKEYDDMGRFGQEGKINIDLLKKLNSLHYYSKEHPKSLGKEWFDNDFIPSIDQQKISTLNIIATLYEHISHQIANTINLISGKKVLATGGGARNKFLIHLIQNKSNKTIVIPDELTIDYKEALIFAYLGVLYVIKQPGALKSVTGATSDSIAGCMYY